MESIEGPSTQPKPDNEQSIRREVADRIIDWTEDVYTASIPLLEDPKKCFY